MGNHTSLSIFQKDLGIPINFQQESGLVNFEALNSTSLSSCQEMWGPLSRWDGDLGFPLGSPHRIQTSLHLVRWKTSLHLSHLREIRPYFLSGNLGIHSTWGRKLSVPLIYLLLREGSSWGACLKLAYLFNRIMGISSLPETIWGAWSFPHVPVLKFVFL